jgi:hypothetical protein
VDIYFFFNSPSEPQFLNFSEENTEKKNENRKRERVETAGAPYEVLKD